MSQVKSEFPFVSVIMPIRNEAAFIHRSLGSVLMQNYPEGRMEVIIVDGMSTDNTRQIIRDLFIIHPQLQICILDNPCKIVPTGMNIALREAKGEIIIRLDGHTLIAPDYVRQCVSHLQKDGIDAVGGAIETLGDTFMAQAIAMAMSTTFGVGDSAFRTSKKQQLFVDSVPFPAYWHETIEQLGGYDEEMLCNEDDEYNFRLRKLGMKLLLAGNVKSNYYCRGSLISLWRQYYRYGYWKVRVLQKHPLQMSLRQFVPPAFVLALLVSVPFAFFPILRLLSFVVPLAYIAANLFASLLTASKRGWAVLPYLPVIFAILHLSYGLGFLAGLFKFWNRWGDKTGKAPMWSKTDG